MGEKEKKRYKIGKGRKVEGGSGMEELEIWKRVKE